VDQDDYSTVNDERALETLLWISLAPRANQKDIVIPGRLLYDSCASCGKHDLSR
jgi:hypothetical protein